MNFDLTPIDVVDDISKEDFEKNYLNIRIDPNTRKLYVAYIKMNGKNGIIIFDLDLANVNYKFNSTRASAYWMLTLKEGKSKITLSQSKITSTKDQKNTFPKDQLDKINEVISQIKNNTIDQH